MSPATSSTITSVCAPPAVYSLGDGHIIIMTTCHFRQLDDVLKDPGIINQTVGF